MSGMECAGARFCMLSAKAGARVFRACAGAAEHTSTCRLVCEAGRSPAGRWDDNTLCCDDTDSQALTALP